MTRAAASGWTDAGGPTFEVGPSDIGICDGGERTIWTVHETARKVCQITPG